MTSPISRWTSWLTKNRKTYEPSLIKTKSQWWVFQSLTTLFQALNFRLFEESKISFEMWKPRIPRKSPKRRWRWVCMRIWNEMLHSDRFFVSCVWALFLIVACWEDYFYPERERAWAEAGEFVWMGRKKNNYQGKKRPLAAWTSFCFDLFFMWLRASSLFNSF